MWIEWSSTPVQGRIRLHPNLRAGPNEQLAVRAGLSSEGWRWQVDESRELAPDEMLLELSGASIKMHLWNDIEWRAEAKTLFVHATNRSGVTAEWASEASELNGAWNGPATLNRAQQSRLNAKPRPQQPRSRPKTLRIRQQLPEGEHQPFWHSVANGQALLRWLKNQVLSSQIKYGDPLTQDTPALVRSCLRRMARSQKAPHQTDWLLDLAQELAPFFQAAEHHAADWAANCDSGLSAEWLDKAALSTLDLNQERASRETQILHELLSAAKTYGQIHGQIRGEIQHLGWSVRWRPGPWGAAILLVPEASARHNSVTRLSPAWLCGEALIQRLER